MKPHDAKQEFQRFIVNSGKDIHALQPHEGIHLMLAFYKIIRSDDVHIETDGDMLLFQWGVYDWGQGEHFSYNITRQLITEIVHYEDDEDAEWATQDFKQLSLTFTYEPNEKFRALSHGNKWCYRPAELEAFTTYIFESPATLAIQGETFQSMELDLSAAD